MLITLLWLAAAIILAGFASGMIAFALTLFHQEALRASWLGAGQWLLVVVSVVVAITLCMRGRLPGTSGRIR